MVDTLNPIFLNENLRLVLNSKPLKDVRFGENTNQKTKISLRYNTNGIEVKFKCYDDPYVALNYMNEDNQPLFNQEVFEFFVAPGKNDPNQYLEFEINPNNAIWIGQITNPNLEGNQISAIMLDPKNSGISHKVKRKSKSWKGSFFIPFSIIGEKSNNYRFNFYRIVAVQEPKNQDWSCNINNCSFQGLFPTMSGENPAFHKPKKFGLLSLH